MLADDFFLVAWDTTGTGKPRLYLQGLTLGLAGALIGELVLENRLTVSGTRLQLLDHLPLRERVADATLADIANSPQHTDVRTWLAYLAQRSLDDVTGRLLAIGLLECVTPKLLKHKQNRYFATEFGPAVWPSTRLRLSLVRRQPLNPYDMLLAALVDACGMTDTVVEDPAHRPTAHRYLAAVLAAMPQPLSDLSRHVSAAVGDAVLTYRT
ncbi:GPP34 family phosphoprotein [Nonomuraea sp. SMC257]|uniref:GPP34 family phosphoprotein n=1 Tax=Nonomuraea montanisoli TaxID=2741721 RepID=A0A7Y6M2S4_9ACTN|nr:GPP34 family phosphoprotein [Nonomuraea montanisoli]NUW32462.1 GPP34 family phosphoprotein [Nonomuraea montanisoli]